MPDPTPFASFRRTRRFPVLLAALAACAGNGATAAVITFPQPTNVLMNFDLGGATPGPTFDSIELTIPRDAVSGMYCAVFTDVLSSPDLNTPSAQYVNGCASGSTRTYSYSDAEMLDGLFSIQFNFFGFGESLTVTDPFAVGIRNGVRTGAVLGTLVPGQNLVGQVNEPGSLALVGVSAIGLAAMRRRRPMASA